MKANFVRILISSISILLLLKVIPNYIADRLYCITFIDNDLNKNFLLLKYAQKLDPNRAEIKFREVELIGENIGKYPESQKKKILKRRIKLLKECIDVCPVVAKYHFYYAITLINMTNNPNIVTKRKILLEFKIAAKLKPYSNMYKKYYYKARERMGAYE